MALPEPEPSRTVGSFLVERQPETLTVTLQHQASFTWNALGFFAFMASSVLILGLLATIKSAQWGVSSAADFFAPKKNHFGFLWLASTLGLLIGFPLYLRHTYKPTITFLFNARNGTIFRNNVLVTRFRRVESIRVHEHGDPAGRYLYALSLLHTDGHEEAIYEVYEERDALTLANEIATYVKRPVTFK
ncbi:hypothetical protein [Armatimonas rosea]|uniref:Uncharacterized protein n=1 Tax=Armatimonas rosea TaxID=685828 RepID=A0A7W9W5M4_ARMRO|nr:hypothetical protein [Armatimonas rosea]MBB6049713.1 hypothetical protein [Armatimonas rosea]